MKRNTTDINNIYYAIDAMFSDSARQPMYSRSSNVTQASDDDGFWRALQKRMATYNENATAARDHEQDDERVGSGAVPSVPPAAIIQDIYRVVPDDCVAPCPSNLIPLRSQRGFEMLCAAEGSGDFHSWAMNFVGQGPLQCGTTSLAVALNTLRSRQLARKPRPVKTSNLANECRALLRAQGKEPRHRFFSTSLLEIGDLAARHHGSQRAACILACDSSVDAFRSAVREQIAARGAVVASFSRATLGYVSSHFAGHMSPVAAYHAATDSLLVLDVARKTFQPAWVPTTLLFAGMDTVDAPRDERCAAVHRGFIVLIP